MFKHFKAFVQIDIFTVVDLSCTHCYDANGARKSTVTSCLPYLTWFIKLTHIPELLIVQSFGHCFANYGLLVYIGNCVLFKKKKQIYNISWLWQPVRSLWWKDTPPLRGCMYDWPNYVRSNYYRVRWTEVNKCNGCPTWNDSNLLFMAIMALNDSVISFFLTMIWCRMQSGGGGGK